MYPIKRERAQHDIIYAACACCDLLERENRVASEHDGRRVVSESTDGYSVSYAQEQETGVTAEEILAEKIRQEAALNLEPTGLLDLGVYADADKY